ncbi:hypothetical protein NCER_102092 [Vairimorpha ceranae BRL01]|uniref:CTLH/CRA C-terminal to LisH motif domain-containing protein n=2 Tax=Vairimorpha ceranae TaxID=40302 RepID=C4VBD9_VAIC1|nr:hypothetical protein AAJ76_4500025263 [Vairimorpha ceranae]EEQ81462.1 hypothetical protein NCER_102092 [Vairimorpha ceranae BRL01]KAF5139663.1 hypothetical protein G9O61_00g021810 [Vairimorpha ceranae]KKO74794.1 hypothetical protein AAJ76_4500025263 [Vairimorpha ceranae]
MSIKKHKEIKCLINKIIKDHLQYSCAVNTLVKYTSKLDKNIIKEMSLRITLINNIKDNRSYDTFVYLKENEQVDDELLVKIAKLSFIDLILNNKSNEAITFAEKYFDNLSDKSLISLIGYTPEDNKHLNILSLGIDRVEIMSLINSLLFKKSTGKSESLLHSTLSYYETLRNNKEM